MILQGIAASQGVGLGRAVCVREGKLDYSDVRYSGKDSEKERLQAALEEFEDRTDAMAQRIRAQVGEKEAEILIGQITMLADPFMHAQMEEAIDSGSCAEAAMDAICTMYADMFAGVEDELMRQRATDVKDIRARLLGILLGAAEVDLSRLPAGTVLVAHDLTPSMTVGLNRENKVQLRALLRAGAEEKNIKIMLPLVTCVEEIRAAWELIDQCKDELEAEGLPYDKDIKVGIMVETPSAALIADLLARESDFFSIGTNDLTQYTMAVDRGNAKVAKLYKTFQPAVLRSIRNVITTAKEAGIPVGMCGEAAADPCLTPLLMTWGKDGVPFRDLGATYYNQFNTERKINSYLKKLNALGWRPPAPAVEQPALA